MPGFCKSIHGGRGDGGKKELADMRYSLPICSISCNLIDFLITLSLPGQVHFFQLFSREGCGLKLLIESADAVQKMSADESDLLRSSHRMEYYFKKR